LVTFNGRNEPQPAAIAAESPSPDHQPTNGITPDVSEDCQAVHGNPTAATTDDPRSLDMDSFPFLVTIFINLALP
jgi:hypothetical protein